MKIGLLMAIITYYLIISIGFIFAYEYKPDISQNVTGTLNNTDFNGDDLDRGGLWSVGVSFSRYVGFVTIGVGLGDIPFYLQVLYSAWSIFMLVISIGFVISSVWDG